MNRICLKRKQTQKKSSMCTLADTINSQNIDLTKSNTFPESNQSSTSLCKPVAITSQSHNQRLFEEFRVQYDQLRQVYEAQRCSYDQLLQEKKRLEIKVLNTNTEFYDKEIKRLRGEVEKLQEENEDFKHKFIMNQNNKKELEASVKVKAEELKRTIHLLEKEKISTVELKHQLNEKEKFFQRMASQMEKSGNALSQSFQDANAKIQKLEQSLKAKTSDLDTIQRSYDQVVKKLADSQRVFKASKEMFEQTNLKKTMIIDELETKLRNMNRSTRETIEGLQTKIEEFKSQRKTENLLIDQQIEAKKNFKQQRINQLEIVRLEELNKELRIQLENQVKLVKSLEEKLLKSILVEEYQELEEQFKKSQAEKEEICKKYEEKVLKLEKQLQASRLDQIKNPGIEQSLGNNFQELLKVQLQENAKVRSELGTKIDEIYNIKSDLEDLRCKFRSSQDEILILNKKLKCQEKNHKIEADVTSQNMKNEIDSLKRKLDMQQTKLDQKIKQIKERENFIMNTIKGRSRQEDVPLIMAEFQRIFEADYATRLSAALQKIQDLEVK